MATEIRYKRINLDVDVKFKSDGTLIPQKITYKAKQYPVTRIVGQRPFIPREVKCKEPIEFTAIIKGKEKKLYYEYSTNTWFSIKPYLLANRFENSSARPG
nr:hypothetical protein [Ruminococcus sp.]